MPRAAATLIPLIQTSYNRPTGRLPVVGVCGRKQHGKDEVADVLGAQGFVRIALADPIKRIAMVLYGFTYAQCYGPEREVVDPRLGVTPRFVFQRLGTEVARSIHADTWVNYVLDQIALLEETGRMVAWHHPSNAWVELTAPNPAGVVIPDVRFPNEVAALRSLGCDVVKVSRYNADGSPYRTGINDDHESEQYIDTIEATRLIENRTTLEALWAQAVGVARAIKAPQQPVG
jgi:hypothetical protein